MHQAKLWTTQVFELAKMKGNLQQTLLFSYAATHNHPKTGQASIRPLVQIITVLQKSSQQKQTTQV